MGIFASIFAAVNNVLYRNISPPKGSIYDFTLPSLGGKEINLKDFRGKKMLIVNTASKCGYTPQLSGLEKIHESFHDRIQVLGFPANDFLWQEPGSNNEIAEFCEINYGVKFPMSQKISVKGKNMHPLFKWLAGKTGRIPTWNFCKYLVSGDGTWVEFFSTKIHPLDERIVNKIK